MRRNVIAFAVAIAASSISACSYAGNFPPGTNRATNPDIKAALYRGWLHGRPPIPVTELNTDSAFAVTVERCRTALAIGTSCSPDPQHRWFALTHWRSVTPDSGEVTIRVLDFDKPADRITTNSTAWTFVRRKNKWVVEQGGPIQLMDYVVPRG